MTIPLSDALTSSPFQRFTSQFERFRNFGVLTLEAFLNNFCGWYKKYTTVLHQAHSYDNNTMSTWARYFVFTPTSSTLSQGMVLSVSLFKTCHINHNSVSHTFPFHRELKTNHNPGLNHCATQIHIPTGPHIHLVPAECPNQTCKKFVCFHDPTSEFWIIFTKHPSQS